MSPREQAYDAVDATVFSSDMLYQPDELALFKTYLSGWNRAVKEHEEGVRAQPPEAD